MKRLLLALMVFLAVLTRSASAGTYDVVSCHAPGAEMRNLAWAFETFNATGKPAPSPERFVLNPLSPDGCASAVGVTFSSEPARRTVIVDDGGAWVFRAPAGTTVKRMQIWRNAATTKSVDDAGTGGVENGWWTLYARAGDQVAGRVVLAAETCPGNVPTPPDAVWCRRGAANFPATVPVTYDVGEPVVSWGMQCTGPATTSLCFTGNGTEGLAQLHLQAAVVTVDDPVAPVVDPGLPGDGVRRTNETFTAAASDSAGIRSLRVLIDGVARVEETYPCDFRLAAPCAAARSRAFDLAGVPDGRHTVTTVAEDASSNVTRSERTVDVDGTPPLIDRVPVSGRRVSVLVSDAGSGVASGTIAVRDDTDAPYTPLKTTLRAGRLTANVPRSFSMSSLGIEVSVADRAGNAFTSVVTSMSLSTRVGRGSARKVRNERARVGYGRAVTLLGRLDDGRWHGARRPADRGCRCGATGGRHGGRARPREHRRPRPLLRDRPRRPQPRRHGAVPGRRRPAAPRPRGRPARPGQRDDPRRPLLPERPGLDPLLRPPARPRRRPAARRQDRRPPGRPARPLVDRRHHPHPRP